MFYVWQASERWNEVSEVGQRVCVARSPHSLVGSRTGMISGHRDEAKEFSISEETIGFCAERQNSICI